MYKDFAMGKRDKETRLRCKLVTRGTDGVEADATDDLSIPDPDEKVGEEIISKAMKKEVDGGD